MSLHESPSSSISEADKGTSSDFAISVESLRLSFGDRSVIDEFTLNVKKGEFVSIVGPSGCGKTTVLNIMAGLVPYQEGSVTLNGVSPKLGTHDIAYMMARDALYPWRSVMRNVTLGADIRKADRTETRRRAIHLLQQVGLGDMPEAYPKALSQGMRQRVALARTFCLDSPVLLMDEPFGALDAQTKLRLEDVLLQLWEEEKRTVVFITHDLNEAIAMSDRVIVMSSRPSRIIADVPIDLGRPRSVRELQSDPRYHELYTTLWKELERGLTP